MEISDLAPRERELHGVGRAGNAASAPRTRRQVLRTLGVGSVAVVIGSAVVPLAAVFDAAPVGAADDGATAAFLQSVELAAVQGYGQASFAGRVTTPAAVSALSAYVAHHTAHAQAIGQYATGGSTGVPNPTLVSALGGQLAATSDEAGVLTVLSTFETALASTYLAAVGTLSANAARVLCASILVVEAEHAIVLGLGAGTALATLVPAFVTEDPKIDPTKYPAS